MSYLLASERTDWASRDISPPNDLYFGAYVIFVPIPIEITSYFFEYALDTTTTNIKLM